MLESRTGFEKSPLRTMLGEGSVDGYHESCSFMVHVCQNPVISAHAMDLADITMKLPEVQATKVGA